VFDVLSEQRNFFCKKCFASTHDDKKCKYFCSNNQEQFVANQNADTSFIQSFRTEVYLCLKA
jgi:hypothetical protein